MNKLEKMICSIKPYAIAGEDFTFKTGEDGNPKLDYWNEVKLGLKPALMMLHDQYMEWARRKKSVIPTFDDSDPMPWLAVEKSTRSIAEEPQKHKKMYRLNNGTVCFK